MNESFSEFSGAQKESVDDRALPSTPDATLETSVREPEMSDYESLIESRAGHRGILDYPHYTRPPSFRGWDVPEVLLGGNHEEIRRWRRQKAVAKTLRNRPDLLDGRKPQKSGH